MSLFFLRIVMILLVTPEMSIQLLATLVLKRLALGGRMVLPGILLLTILFLISI